MQRDSPFWAVSDPWDVTTTYYFDLTCFSEVILMPICFQPNDSTIKMQFQDKHLIMWHDKSKDLQTKIHNHDNLTPIVHGYVGGNVDFSHQFS